MLQADSAGFLMGEKLDLSGESDLLRTIQRDVRAIRNAVVSAGRITRSGAGKASGGSGTPLLPVTPARGRRSGARNRLVATPVGVIKADSLSATAAPANTRRSLASMPVSGAAIVATPARVAPERVRAPVASPDTPERGANGRFLPKNGGGTQAEEESERHFFKGALRNISSAIENGIKANADVADPMVKAYGEIATPLAGLAGGMKSIAGFNSSEERFYTRWFKRIAGIMTFGRRSDQESADKTQDLLEEIRDTSGGRDGKDGKSSAGGLLGGKVLGGLLGGAAKGGRGLMALLKKIPVLGALLGGGAFLMDAFTYEMDPRLSRREKDQRIGGSGGGILGMLGGAATGAAAGAFLGPVGMIAGGLLGGFLGDSAGQIIGEKVGLWVNDLRGADIPGKIGELWNSAITPLASVADTISTWWTENIPSFSSIRDGVTGFLSDKLGIDLPSVDQVADVAVTGLSGTVIGRTVARFFGVDEAAGINAPQVAEVSAPPPKVPASPAPIPVPQAPEKERTRLNSQNKENSISVKAVVPAQDAGQDIRDRQISHIVTGGMK